MSEDAGIEPRTVAMSALAGRPSTVTTRLDLIQGRLDLIQDRGDLINKIKFCRQVLGAPYLYWTHKCKIAIKQKFHDQFSTNIYLRNDEYLWTLKNRRPAAVWRKVDWKKEGSVPFTMFNSVVTSGNPCKYLSYIYLGSSVCHIPVIFLSVVVAERWAILYVLVIKLTKEKRRRVCRGRDYRWRDRKGTDRRGRVWIYFSLFKPNLINM
jgi:hypothetical protein